MLGGRMCHHSLPAQHREDGHSAYSSPVHSNLAETFGSGAALPRATAWKGPREAGIRKRAGRSCWGQCTYAASGTGHSCPQRLEIWERGLSWTQQERTCAAQSFPLGTPPQQRRDARGGNLVEDGTHTVYAALRPPMKQPSSHTLILCKCYKQGTFA